jgi:hypothetical protein
MKIMKKQNKTSFLILGILGTMFFSFYPQILNVYGQMDSTNSSPLKQVLSGISAQDVKCNQNFVLIIKLEDGSPACVKQTTANVLIIRGWGTSVAGVSVSNTGGNMTSSSIITLQDNGNMIHLKIGERFLLKLGENYNWSPIIDNQTVASRVPNIMVIRGAQGLYEAHNPGEAVLTATGDPLCRSVIPACGMPSIIFRLDIVVS